MYTKPIAAVTCCFSGHRPEKLPWRTNENDPRCIRLKEALYDLVATLHEGGIRHFICGMAKGCDFYFCEAVIRLRDEHPDITIEAALPCETQAVNWSEEDRDRYFYLVHQCDKETMLQHHYTDDCMINRNKYMVDNSSTLIAISSGAPGGTMQTISYAKKCGLTVITISPNEI